jgi:hypothetical protein
VKDHKYEPPAVERREDVKGLLSVQRGSYCPPKTAL